MASPSYFRRLLVTARGHLPAVIVHAFAASMAVALLIAANNHPESLNELAQLRRMAAETPLPAGFQQRRTSEYNKQGSAMIIIKYYSMANYDEVGEFYSKVLIAKGWGLPVEKSSASLFGHAKRSLTFHSGEFLIAIGEEDSSEFSVIYRWEAK